MTVIAHLRRWIGILAAVSILATPIAATESNRTAAKPKSQSSAKRPPSKRSAAARRAFMKQTGYPHGRPGYVIDHIVPLACGGLDAPSNMQWQTTAAGRAKDKVERQGYR